MNIVYRVIAVLLFFANGAHAQTLTEDTFHPNPEFQNKLDDIFFETLMPTNKEMTEEKWGQLNKALANSLIEMSGGDRIRTIQEIYYFWPHATPRGDGTEVFFLAVSLLKKFNFTLEEGIEASLPFLGPNENKLKVVPYYILMWNKFSVANFARSRQKINDKYDLSIFLPYMREHPESHKPLLDLMFQVNPHKTLLFALELYEKESEKVRLNERFRKGIKGWKAVYRRNGTHKLRESRDLLEMTINELSASKEWWARMYIAETIRQIPSLQTPELIKGLKEDEDPYIQASVKLLEEQAKKSAQPRFKIFYGLDSVDKPE